MELEAKVNVLMVDDQPEGLLALEAMLEPLGQNLVKARSGQEALRHLLSHEFAVVLLDVQMPGMDGFETADLMRQRDRTRHTPIIFLTAGQKADRHVFRGYAAGAVDYLFKPIDPEILRSKVLVFVDLTKKAELVRRQTEQLVERERQAWHLLAELEQKNRDLEAVNKELEAFSYSVSHDLRAPLRSLDGFSQILLEDYAQQLDDQGKKYLRHVRESAQHMGQLIDGLLALSRVTRSELRREQIDLTKVARRVAARLLDPQQERQVEFVIENSLTADGDGRLLEIVLENLLGNAWKFTGKCSQARIEFGRAIHNGQTAFYVRDNGAGFDMAHAGKLFEAFQRLHGRTEFEGHGIGLATVNRIVQRHGGRVWAEGEVARGATFYFTLAGRKGNEREGDLPGRTEPPG